ncbi:MAG TPA: PQQ-binding-like beta-propeller repeat protein [Fimbriiglobus sp.]|jgi:outer membrane protein assembly factor BamB
MNVLKLAWVVLLGCGCNPNAPKSLSLKISGSPVVQKIPDDAPVPGAADRVKVTRPGSDWPRFLGPAGNCTSPETGILTTWPKDGLKKLWECSLGVGYAPAVVADGRLVHFDRVGDKARATCRNAETGEAIWRFEYETGYVDMYGYDAGPRCSPIIDRGRVFLHGVEGMLYALNLSDGKEIWKVDTKAVYHFHQNFFGVGSTPVVEGDKLIVAVGGSPKTPDRVAILSQAKGNGSCIVAFDVATGKEIYKFGDDLASFSSPTVATIRGKRVGLYFSRGGLVGFDPAAGKQLFRFPWRARILESAIAANPVVAGNDILISESYERGSALLAFDGTGVKPVWTDTDNDRDEKALMAHFCTPVYHDGFVYGCSSRHSPDADLRCVNLKTGKIAWRERRTGWCTLLKVDGHLLVLGEQGELRLLNLNPTKYDEIARWESPDLSPPSWAPPVLSHGLLYLRGRGSLVCYELIPKK